MSEVWDPVFWNPVLFSGKQNVEYEVSNHGEVREKETGRMLHQYPHGGDPGSRYVGVTLSGVKFYVHRLVLENFLANPLNKPEGNHKNGNKQDNRLLNLEWVTKSENIKHAHALGLSVNPIPKKPVRQMTLGGVEVAVHESLTAAAISVHSNPSAIGYAASGRQNSCAGYRWEWVHQNAETEHIRPTICRHQHTPIQQMTRDGVVITTYPCLTDATAATNGQSSHISAAARGMRDTSGGFRWAYVVKR
jgi:HNH endonuclease